MYCVKTVTPTLTWVGGNDRRLAMFEGVYSVPAGVSYNSYVLMDDKIAIFDTVDKAVGDVFFSNLEYTLKGRSPDYLVVHHMEPDHSATMEQLVLRYPDIKIVCNAKIHTMIKQFFNFDIDSRVVIVNEGDTLSLGQHTLRFINAPMVHWPEVMMTYEESEGILFSADAFGHFGAINGAIFADEVDFERDYMDEARRYYANIVGKYGAQVMNVLKAAEKLDIKLLCPLHGFVWRKNIASFVDKYKKWATYTPEVQGVLIAYASIYGNTENAAEILSSQLREKGIETKMYDVSVTPASDIISDAFKYSHLVFASATYNAGVFVTMEALLHDLAAHSLKNRTIGFIQNGSWAASSGKLMREILAKLPNTTFIEDIPYVKSSVKEDSLASITALANRIAEDFPAKEEVARGDVDGAAMHKLSYGLFALFTNDGKRDNACIVNTAMQISSSPMTISVCVNKANYTCETIQKTGIFNVSVLDESVPFEIFKRFGFASGRDTDKLSDFDDVMRSENMLLHLDRYTNAFMSGKVIKEVDCGTHILFIAEVTEAQTFKKGGNSVTYAYYFANIKPKAPAAPAPAKETTEKVIVGWECKICGYVYEGAELPADYVCPLCKHPASDFTPIYGKKKEEEKKIVGWVCKICGYVYDGAELPADFVCPLCKHPASDFEPIWG